MATDSSNQRIENLEIKVSYLEDLVDTLNLTIYGQQEQIDRVAREVVRMREQAPQGSGDGGPCGASSADERPPHY